MLARPSYQARQIKRRRRTRAQVEQLDEQILDVLRADHPQSVRHCFYRMTDPRLPEPVEKTDNGYQQVQHRCAELRRTGALRYSWITDATRRGYHVATYTDEADFIREVSREYRADIWHDAEVYCEVWVESRSIAGVIEADCKRLGVSLYPAGGFTSMTLAWQSAEYIRAFAGGRPVVIFYIGDYDPAGVLIDRDIHQKLCGHLGADVEIDFRRLAISTSAIAATSSTPQTTSPKPKPRSNREKRRSWVPSSAPPARCSAASSRRRRSVLRLSSLSLPLN